MGFLFCGVQNPTFLSDAICHEQAGLLINDGSRWFYQSVMDFGGRKVHLILLLNQRRRSHFSDSQNDYQTLGRCIDFGKTSPLLQDLQIDTANKFLQKEFEGS